MKLQNALFKQDLPDTHELKCTKKTINDKSSLTITNNFQKTIIHLQNPLKIITRFKIRMINTAHPKLISSNVFAFR